MSMSFYQTPMERAFFERHVPQLIQAIQALTAALDKPAQTITMPVEADPEFLSQLYYGEYESAPFRHTPEGAELTRAVNAASAELKAFLPKECYTKLIKYQDTLNRREGASLQMAYESGFRTAVQMIVAGLSRPKAEQAGSENE